MCKRRKKNHTAAQTHTRAQTHESKMQTAICPFTVQSNEKKPESPSKSIRIWFGHMASGMNYS